jgi:CHAT domain-containing protein
MIDRRHSSIVLNPTSRILRQAAVAGSLTVLSLLSGATVAFAAQSKTPMTLARSVAQTRTTLASSAPVVAPASASASASAQLAAVSADLESGRNAYRSGDFKKAVQIWQATADQLETQNNPIGQATALNYLALAHQELNQWDAAKEAINRSLKLLRSQPSAEAGLWAQALNTQAGLQLQTGQADAALNTWQQAQKYYVQAQDPIGSIGSQINQAQALQSLGFYRRAKTQLEGLNRKLADLPDSDVKIAGFRNLGTVLQVIGDMTGSQSALEEAVMTSRRLKSSTELSASLLALSDATLNNGKEETALSYLQEAESIAMNPLEKAQAQLGQLNLYLNQGNLKEVSARLPVVKENLLKLPPSRMSIYSIVNLAANLNRLQKPEDVVALKDLSTWLAQSIQAARQLQDREAEAYALHQLGQIYIQAQQWTDAQVVTEQSLTIARQMQAEHIISQGAWQLGQILKAKGDREKSLQAYQESVTALQALRGDLVAINPEVQFSFRESIEPVYREMVDLLLTESPSQKDLIQARGLIEALQVAELDNFFREACLDKVKQIDQLDPTATVVYPILLKERVAVILSTAGQPLRYHSKPKDTKQVNESLNGLLAAMNPVSDRAQRLKISSQIYDWLIRPAEEAGALKDTKTLVFVLDGKLRNIPMAALYDGKQYLIEKYAVTLSTGLQLMEARQLDNKNIGAIVGGISEARSGFSSLPAVKNEIQQISSLISARTLLNEQFTSTTLTDRLSNSSADVIHLATHGQFSSRLEDTFLLTWDGRMNIKELAEVLQTRQSSRSRPIELLVLSACDTAAGDDQAALGLAGLAVKSGARSTLATLWPVKDAAAAKLMSRFYEQLRKPGMNKAEALRQAQIEIMKKTDFEDPFFWSGFVLVGNWR